MSSFDECSGIEACNTTWGRWWQTLAEVHLDIRVKPGTTAKAIAINIQPNHIKCTVDHVDIIEGNLYDTVVIDESTWTLEDRKNIHIQLAKSKFDAHHPKNCWKSVVENQDQLDPFAFDKMQKKLTLERFQQENPGMDFSGAEISGNYQTGGPQLPTYSSP